MILNTVPRLCGPPVVGCAIETALRIGSQARLGVRAIASPRKGIKHGLGAVLRKRIDRAQIVRAAEIGRPIEKRPVLDQSANGTGGVASALELIKHLELRRLCGNGDRKNSPPNRMHLPVVRNNIGHRALLEQPGRTLPLLSGYDQSLLSGGRRSLRSAVSNFLTMAGLDPATQHASVSERMTLKNRGLRYHCRADARHWVAGSPAGHGERSEYSPVKERDGADLDAFARSDRGGR